MRTDSIYKVLERADRAGGTSYVNDLMIFLAETAGDRFALARKLVVDDWGFKTSKTALCEGYKSYYAFWRLERAAEWAKATEKATTGAEHLDRLIGQQTFAYLADPELPPELAIKFIKLQVEKLKAGNDSRRVALLESKMAEAREVIACAAKKGGLSPETLAEMERALKLL